MKKIRTSTTLLIDTVAATRERRESPRGSVRRRGSARRWPRPARARRSTESPNAHSPIADVTPMIAASSSWPPSQALTLTVTSRDAASTRSRRSRGNKRRNDSRRSPRIDEHVEGQDQDREDAEDAAGDAHDRTGHFRHRVSAAARRLLHRLAHRQVFLQPALGDQEPLPRSNHLAAPCPTSPAPCCTSGGKIRNSDERRSCRGWRGRGRGSPASAGSAPTRSAAASAAR